MLKNINEDVVQMCLEHWQAWDIKHFSVAVSDHPHINEIFLTSSLSCWLLLSLIVKDSNVYAFFVKWNGKSCLALENAFALCLPRKEPEIGADEIVKFHIDFSVLWIFSFTRKIALLVDIA